MKILIKDLQCYKNATEEQKNHRLVKPNRGFDLSKLQSENLQKEIAEFIEYRGKVLSLNSIRTELGNYSQFCRVIETRLPNLNSFLDISWEDLDKACKEWLFMNGYKYVTERKRRDREKGTSVASVVSFARTAYFYYHKEEPGLDFEKDVWIIAEMPFPINYNPVKHVKSISFRRIEQLQIRTEIKRIVLLHLREKALGTVCLEMTAIGHFSEWLAEEHPEIKSLTELNRFIIEEYLFYVNTEATGRKSYSKVISHLKGVIQTAALVWDSPWLDTVLLNSDSGKEPEVIYKSYSDDELKRLNKGITEDEEQMARALILHQIIGTRISETLTIKKNAIRLNNRGRYVVSIYQIKSHKSYDKLLSDDAVSLIKRSIEYTKERYGDREYIFVNDRNPDEPMTYGKIQYRLNALIRQNGIRDDQGELFTVGTHLWRHTYARKLTELNVDDVTIAKLLGQSGTGNLKYYRKMRPETLYKETKPVLDEMNPEIRAIMEEWHGKK